MVLCDKCKNETEKVFNDLLCKKCHDARIKRESYLRNKERRDAEKRKIQEEFDNKHIRDEYEKVELKEKQLA